MITDETQPTTYYLFDHSYAGGSWNAALIDQVAVQKRRAEAAEAEVTRLKAERMSLVTENAEAAEVLLKLLVLSRAQGATAAQHRQKITDLAGSLMALIEDKNRLQADHDSLQANHALLQEASDLLRPAAEAGYALRRHIFYCDDCEQELPCERWFALDSAVIDAVDAVYGKPEAQAV